MKKRVWTVLPIYLVFVLLMFLMSFASLRQSFVLFAVESVASLIALAVVLVMMLRFNQYVRKTVTNVCDSVSNADQNAIDQFDIATGIIGEHGEILLYNSHFGELFADLGELTNENISLIFDGETAETLSMNHDGTDTRYKDKKLTVYTNKVDSGYMILIIDNTYYKKIEREFYDTKKSVALVLFDNVEEFMSDDENLAGRAMISVENIVSTWASTNSCLFRKLSDGKYIIIFDEKLLASLVESKFPLLEQVRDNRLNDRNTTISIGIGRGCATLTESHACAKKALDMALGRGGDQVAILDNGEYDFFGGVSKGVESTNKVRVRLFADSIRSAINRCDKVLIMGHRFSDMDCVGSAVGIMNIVVNSFHKPAHIVVDYDKSMAKQLIDRVKVKYPNAFVSEDKALHAANDRTLLFIVDTHSPDFVESKAVYDFSGMVVVIDHHRKMVNYINDADVFFHEPTASSTSEMVTELVAYLGDDTITRPEAEALLSGIMLDTKNFVIKTGVRTFEAAAYLRKKGADTVVLRDLFANSIDTYKEKYMLVSNAHIVNNCAIAVVDKTISNSRLISAQAADDLLGIQDVYASFVISRIDSGLVNISARSYGKVNVQIIMEKLGGGGHQTMAAAQIANISVDEAKKRLIDIIKEQ